MNTKTSFLLAILLVTIASVSLAARPESSGPFSAELKNSKGKPSDQNSKGGGNDAGSGFFGPGGGGSGVPGFGTGWGNGIGGGFGSGFGGPSGGYSRGGIVNPSVVCKERGPCYLKKLTCPTKCFTSFSRSGKGYGGGGGGGGCTMDCKKKCIAYC